MRKQKTTFHDMVRFNQKLKDDDGPMAHVMPHGLMVTIACSALYEKISHGGNLGTDDILRLIHKYHCFMGCGFDQWDECLVWLFHVYELGFTEAYDVLTLCGGQRGKTVAHFQSEMGEWSTDCIEILRLCSAEGESVAGIQACFAAADSLLRRDDFILLFPLNVRKQIIGNLAHHWKWWTNNEELLKLADWWDVINMIYGGMSRNADSYSQAMLATIISQKEGNYTKFYRFRDTLINGADAEEVIS